jgi:hypothetical protein
MAYHHAANAGVVPVATDRVQINGGFSMPNLGGWFSGGTKVTSAFVVSDDVGLGIHCTVFLVMCSQFHLLLAPKGLDTCELLIFRQGIFRNALVNLRPGDTKHMKDVIGWYVQFILCPLIYPFHSCLV